MIIQYTPNLQRETEKVTREAFWNVYQPGCDEHFILHQLRTSDYYIPQLDVVAMDGDKVVGSAVCCKGLFTLPDGTLTTMLNLGPIAVLPDYQRKGIGSQLIKYLLTTAKQLGYPAVVLCGNKDYYSKFGFISASKVGIFYKDTDHTQENDFFMINVLDDSFTQKGEFVDNPVYTNVDKQMSEQFDSQFEHKQKLKLPGQLWG